MMNQTVSFQDHKSYYFLKFLHLKKFFQYCLFHHWSIKVHFCPFHQPRSLYSFKNLINLSIAKYWVVLSSAAPEIINGVLASSIRQESISSTIAKISVPFVPFHLLRKFHIIS